MLVDGVDAEVMVEMPMRTEQMHGFQFVVVDIVHQCVALFIVIGATVYDHTLLALVAHHVGVLLQEVKHESLDVQHGR